jgi:ATP-dependent protease HslVU (ClpYQ) peptidase subunit
MNIFLFKNLLDDLELPDGSLSNSVTNFANEWRTDSTVNNIKL